MYKLIEYSDNYSDASGNLWKFKRDEVPANNADLSINNCHSFKCKEALVGKTANHNYGSFVKDTKIVVQLKHYSNFWRSLEMQLINCRVHFELNCIKDSILSSAGDSANFEITDAKLHVPITTLSTKDSEKLTKQLSEGFKKYFYWNSYQTKPAKVIEKGQNLYELLNAAFQGVRRLSILVYFVAAGTANNGVGIKDNKTYILPRGEIKNDNVLIDGRNFYDHPINGLIRQYD